MYRTATNREFSPKPSELHEMRNTFYEIDIFLWKRQHYLLQIFKLYISAWEVGLFKWKIMFVQAFILKMKILKKIVTLENKYLLLFLFVVRDEKRKFLTICS